MHTLEWILPAQKNGKRYVIRRSPTGVLVSKHVISSGEWIVKVRSFQQLQTGDKVSTGHGQKGVVTIMSYEDMPQAITDAGGVVVPDMVVAMSSIICRQTNGQLYETHKSMESARLAAMSIAQAGERWDVTEKVTVMKGSSGRMYHTCLANGTMELTKASLGFLRVRNQTQMTRERKNTLQTPTRRTRGGGVAYGEMEVQAAVAAGLTNCCLRLLRGCTNPEGSVDVTLPYDTIVVDCISAIVYSGSNVYTLEVDQ
ncbi:DNA-directed RNA polymerase [Colletotrichum higginsianum IMI 349063]|uniref:DNA-directed RNA polymerase n=1 Tax=Colletotrichum higginsianum (strain IMI 349063) TaxID=759273 RepID=A0A1B7XQJ3_COLHI|nr:DNA-directed RNA polymerase [Colletotrichum higginsianum IMI 349063]OBR02035.1 DNA-directed RNA polymerase [Colletotrichum higginsianum IMI 349063]